MRISNHLIGAAIMLTVSSQTWAQIDQTVQEKFEAFRQQTEKDFKGFREHAATDYQHFRDSVNQAYADFLEQAWTEFEKGPAIPKPIEKEIQPKPMPKEEWNKPIEDHPIQIDEVIMPVPPTPQPLPIAPIPKVEEPKEEWVSFMFYGTPMKVRFADSQRFALLTLNEHSIADAWRKLSQEGNNNLIRDCLGLRLQHRLCDWAYLKLVEQIGQACMGEGNEATLLTAFIYCQSGYQMRMGMSGQRLYLLYASDYSLYDVGSYSLDNTRYYVLAQPEPARLFICQAAYPQEQALSLTIPQAQHFAGRASETREFHSLNHPDVRCKVQVNKNLIDFYNTYPTSMVGGNFMTRWAMYANTPLQEEVKEQLYPGLRKHLVGKSQKDAVGVLLDFVQMAFVYGYDDKVWGYDRAFFAEETLFYPYADCEDRSILFSRLVRDLLGLKVVLVYYPGHLATAVQFTEQVAGDYLMLNNQRFVVCDPTYFNAGVGLTMTGMDNKGAKVILLE